MGLKKIDGLGVPVRRLLACFGALTAALVLLLLLSSPSYALIHRGHTLGATFGEAFGEGDKLSGPSDVAVNEATGDVYVLDGANNRVVRFGPGPEHAFIEAWGFGVGGGAAYEKCTSKCKAGIAGNGSGQFSAPVSIAIDNAAGSPSKGDVYIVPNATLAHAVVDKFKPEGTLIAKLIQSKEEKEEVEGPILGVAVDPTGIVWVEREDEEEEFTLQRFNNASPQNQPIGELVELEIENLEGNRPGRPGFAVDGEHHVFVTYEPGGKDYEEILEEEEEIKEREQERKQKKEILRNEKPEQPCTVHICLTAKLAVVEEEGKIQEAVPLNFELDRENSTGVAVDVASGAQASGDTYLDNVTSMAAFTAGGTLIQRFGSGQITAGAGVTVNSHTGEVLVADAGAGRIEDFVPSPPGAPTIKAGSVAAAQVNATSATLRATIDANGAETHFRFQYGTEPCASAATPCQETPAGDLGQAFGDQSASAHVSALTPDTTYHLRVIAENSFAEGAGAVVSGETTFTTQTSVLGGVLPDGREWELVSPARRNGGPALPISNGFGVVQASADGKAITYLTSAPSGDTEPEGNRSPEGSQLLGARLTPGTWSAHDIATHNGPAVGVRPGLPREYEQFSTDLSEALVTPPTEEPLSAEATEPTVYLRHNAACEATPASCFQPLVTPANDTAGTAFGHQIAFAGGSRDLHHVVFNSSVALTAGANKQASLYEWGEGRLELVSVLPSCGSTTGPCGTQAPGPLLGSGEVSGRGMTSSAISDDGSRVVFHSSNRHLYMRLTTLGQTLQIDEPNTGVATPKVSPAPEFQVASADGSKVFFTDPQRLTASSNAPEPSANPPSDLYVFEPGQPAGKRLTDLSVGLNNGEGAAVLGALVGASADGSVVYFVANGVLAAGAEPGTCRGEAPPGRGCSLYVARQEGESWGAPAFIARLSSEDSPDWGRLSNSENLKNKTSRVSPNGQYVAFMSDQSLTGYDNTDVTSGAADEEVFLYHLGGGVTCVSCNPSGAQPQGVFDTEETGEGLGLLVDRALTWIDQSVGTAHWLAASVPGWTAVGLQEARYQSRYVTDSGRVFFDAADSLVPRDINQGKEDVYEYEPVGVGSCTTPNTTGGCVALLSSGESAHESAFLDASESGNDAFIYTASKLAPQDLNEGYEIFDARVCGREGAEPCPPPIAAPGTHCNSEACKAPSGEQPSYQTPASASSSGEGNLPNPAPKPTPAVVAPKKPTRAQLLAAAIKKCHHKFKRKKFRVACEKLARRHYRAKPAAKHSSVTTVKHTVRKGR